MNQILEALVIARSRCATLWPFGLVELRNLFVRACLELGLHNTATKLYSLRHGGASDDLLRKRRTLAEVQRRGRWAAPSSLRRYAKETRLLKQMGLVSKEVFTFGVSIEKNFLELLTHGVPQERIQAVLRAAKGHAALAPSLK